MLPHCPGLFSQHLFSSHPSPGEQTSHHSAVPPWSNSSSKAHSGLEQQRENKEWKENERPPECCREERREETTGGWALPGHSPAGEENFQGTISSFFVSLARGETQGFYPSLSWSIFLEVVVVVCLFVCVCLVFCLFVWMGWSFVVVVVLFWEGWFFKTEFLCGALAVLGLTW